MRPETRNRFGREDTHIRRNFNAMLVGLGRILIGSAIVRLHQNFVQLLFAQITESAALQLFQVDMLIVEELLQFRLSLRGKVGGQAQSIGESAVLAVTPQVFTGHVAQVRQLAQRPPRLIAVDAQRAGDTWTVHVACGSLMTKSPWCFSAK